MLLLTVLTAALAVTAATSLVLRLNAPRPPLGGAVSASTQKPPLVQAAEQWLMTNLPYSGKVIADDAVRAALIDSGFPPASVTPPAGVLGCAAVSFVVVTAALEAAAISDGSLGRCLHTALPIAVFGTGATAVRIAQTTPGGSPALAAQRRLDARDRMVAGVALAGNPSVRVSAGARAQLRLGGLDLRAGTVIAVLAGHTLVHITAITGVAAERAAGLPARTVELALADPAVLPSVLAGLSAPFRPSMTVHTGPLSVRLVWPFTTATIPALH